MDQRKTHKLNGCTRTTVDRCVHRFVSFYFSFLRASPQVPSFIFEQPIYPHTKRTKSITKSISFCSRDAFLIQEKLSYFHEFSIKLAFICATKNGIMEHIKKIDDFYGAGFCIYYEHLYDVILSLVLRDF